MPLIYPYTSPALPSHWCIYWTRAQIVGNGFCSSVVEHWSSNPEDAGSIPSLGVAFFATGPGLGLIMYILTTLKFPTHNFDFHLLTTSVNAKYYYWFSLSCTVLVFVWINAALFERGAWTSKYGTIISYFIRKSRTSYVYTCYSRGNVHRQLLQCHHSYREGGMSSISFQL